MLESNLTPSDWDIAGQCFRASVEGPFFKGILFGEREFPSVVGPDWDQLRCILRFWPDLDSIELYREFTKLGEKYEHRPWRSPSELSPKIYGVVGTCIYWLGCGFYSYPDSAPFAKAALFDEAWPKYIDVTTQKVREVNDHWRLYQKQRWPEIWNKNRS